MKSHNVQRLEVDRSLELYAYRCHPEGCPSERTCCVGVSPEVSPDEIATIDNIMDELARLQPALVDGTGYIDAFEAGDDGHTIEPLDEEQGCPFLFHREGRALCSIHHHALENGLPVESIKPRACRHWPLVVDRSADGTLRIAIHPRARALGCVAPVGELPQQPTVRDAFADEIDELKRLVAGG